MRIEEFKGKKCANSLDFYDNFKRITGKDYAEFSQLAQDQPNKYSNDLTIYTYVAMRMAAEPALAEGDWKIVRNELDTSDIMDSEAKLIMFEIGLLSGKKVEQLMELAKKSQKK